MDVGGADALPGLPALAEFATVARWQHVTRAAEELGLAQSTLSRRLRRLEDAVGVPLLRRRGRHVELTRAGERLAAVSDSVLADLGRAVEDIRRSRDPQQGTVSFAFLSTLGVAVVPDILRGFRRRHPLVRFQLSQEGHEAALAKLQAGAVDMCLTSPLPDEPAFSSLALYRQPVRLVVPEGHDLARTGRAPLAAAAGEVFVGFKPGYGLRRLGDEWCRRVGFSPRLGFEGEDVSTVRGMVSAGLGVALLPASTVPAPGTVELETTDVRPSRTIGLVTARGRNLPPPAAVFHTFLAQRGASLVAQGIS
jgi:DNA-binding transcriptional LysR family regulator